MREKLIIGFAMLILAVMIPYLGTMLLTGRTGTEIRTLDTIDTGKTVSLELDGTYTVLDVEAYLAGYLPAVLDGEEDVEVWKVMAVIERTNIYKKMDGHGNIDEADLDMQYVSDAELQTRWGEKNYEIYKKKIEDAVLATSGQTLQYDGEWIDALYHQISIGTTVSAEELCGEAVPYLVSVVSNHDVEAKDYMYLAYVDKSESGELQITESTEHGYVKKVLCGETELTGEEMQEKYQLPSLNYYIEDMGDQYRIVCLGQGHGMGLSIYGAGELVEEGKDYTEILEYYYPGVQITKLFTSRGKMLYYSGMQKYCCSRTGIRSASLHIDAGSS